MKLVLDGVGKAQQARAKGRVRTLGLVLAHAYREGEKKSADSTEELMRVATGLDGDDIRVLAWLCEGMKDKYNPTTGEVDFESANAFWGDFEHKQGRFGGERGTSQGMNTEVCTLRNGAAFQRSIPRPMLTSANRRAASSWPGRV